MRLYFRAASIIFRPSQIVSDGFFSTYTSLPAWQAQTVASACQCSGVAMTTPSTSLSSKTWRMSVTRWGRLPRISSSLRINASPAFGVDFTDVFEFRVLYDRKIPPRTVPRPPAPISPRTTLLFADCPRADFGWTNPDNAAAVAVPTRRRRVTVWSMSALPPLNECRSTQLLLSSPLASKLLREPRLAATDDRSSREKSGVHPIAVTVRVGDAAVDVRHRQFDLLRAFGDPDVDAPGLVSVE